MDYYQYQLLFKQMVTKGITTGEPTEEKITYIKLNYRRSKRLEKTIMISKDQKECF